MRPLLFERARLLDPESKRDKTGDLLVNNGRITAIGDVDSIPPEAEIVDCRGLCLAPGLVDMRAQFGEPGAEHKERLESGIAAAAAGGVDGVVAGTPQGPLQPMVQWLGGLYDLVLGTRRRLATVGQHTRLTVPALPALGVLRSPPRVLPGVEGRLLACPTTPT